MQSIDPRSIPAAEPPRATTRPQCSRTSRRNGPKYWKLEPIHSRVRTEAADLLGSDPRDPAPSGNSTPVSRAHARCSGWQLPMTGDLPAPEQLRVPFGDAPAPDQREVQHALRSSRPDDSAGDDPADGTDTPRLRATRSLGERSGRHDCST